MPEDEQLDEDPAHVEPKNATGGGGQPTGETQAATNRNNDPPS